MFILKVGVRTPLVTTSLFPKPPAPPQGGAGLSLIKLTRKRNSLADGSRHRIPNELFAKGGERG